MGKNTAEIASDWKDTSYYDDAEAKDIQLVFWKEESPFFEMFQKLNLAHVVELAVGHGRHVDHYFERAGKITLVDVNEENINFCKNRFQALPNISYLVNSGFDLKAIADSSVTAIFSYDAMVHFDLFDIASYLDEAYRILVPNGLVLFHHSNYSNGPGQWYTLNPGWRNFMSADIFKHLAINSGFKVIEQRIIDWVGQSNLDCISLCKKVGFMPLRTRARVRGLANILRHKVKSNTQEID